MRRSLLIIGAVCCLVGCNKGPSAGTVPVSGTVTFKGQPLEDAEIVFEPKVVDGKRASGITDASGKFQLRTYLGGANTANGAEPGDYEVSVKKMGAAAGIKPPADSTQPPEAPTRQAVEGENKPMAYSGGELVTPEMYANPKTSGFTASVTQSGQNQFTFELTEK